MSEQQWFYAKGGERKGPISESELAALVADGTVDASTLVWAQGMEDWAAAGKVLPAFGAPPTITPPPVSTSGPAPSGEHPNDFRSAVETVLKKKYGTFTGRARRPEFWWFALFSFGASLILSTIEAIIFGGDNGIFSMIFSLAMLVPSLAVGARRLHDIGKSGWWQLIVLVPLIGFIVLIYFYAQRGDQNANEYGPA